MARHGYIECACFTCFDTAVCSAPAGEECDQHEHHLCSECDAAGCDGHSDCAREDLDEGEE